MEKEQQRLEAEAKRGHKEHGKEREKGPEDADVETSEQLVQEEEEEGEAEDEDVGEGGEKGPVDYNALDYETMDGAGSEKDEDKLVKNNTVTAVAKKPEPEAAPTGNGAVEEELVTKIIAKEKSQEPEMKPKKVEEHGQNKVKKKTEEDKKVGPAESVPKRRRSAEHVDRGRSRRSKSEERRQSRRSRSGDRSNSRRRHETKDRDKRPSRSPDRKNRKRSRSGDRSFRVKKRSSSRGRRLRRSASEDRSKKKNKGQDKDLKHQKGAVEETKPSKKTGEKEKLKNDKDIKVSKESE
ncbi:hypothetical protein B7P43_G13822, partial [Cryptotermes secundus]